MQLPVERPVDILFAKFVSEETSEEGNSRSPGEKDEATERGNYRSKGDYTGNNGYRLPGTGDDTLISTRDFIRFTLRRYFIALKFFIFVKKYMVVDVC